MNEEELSRFILEQTTESLKNKYPQDMGDNNFGSNIELSNTKDFFKPTSTCFVMGGVVSDKSLVSEEGTNLARASAFAMSAVTGLYMTYALRDSIDEFFADPTNAHHFDGYSEEQKTALRVKLKDTVKERLAVDAKTDEGKALVQRLTEKFEGYEQENEQNGAQNSASSQSRLRDFQSGLSALNSVLVQVVSDSGKKKALDTVKQHTKPNDDFVRIITESLENDFANLAKEEEVITRTVATFNMDHSANTVNVQEFLSHYNSEKGLNGKEKDWALDMFDNLGLDHVDFANFMAGGNPLFTPEELAKNNKRNMKIDVIANALMGNNVVLKENGKETLISEKIEEPEKNWFEKFIDLIKEKLGIGSNERQRVKQVKEVEENFRAKMSERISFEDLSGLNALKKVTGETNQQTQRSVGKGGLTK